MDPNREMMNEMYRLTKENNAMLHAMRRHAFIGGIFKYTIWIILFVIAPLWLYSTYLAPVVEQMTRTMDQIQGTGAQAKVQMGKFEEMWKSFQSMMPGSSNTTSTTGN